MVESLKSVFFEEVLLLEDIFDTFDSGIFKIKVKHRAFERSKIGKPVHYCLRDYTPHTPIIE